MSVQRWLHDPVLSHVFDPPAPADWCPGALRFIEFAQRLVNLIEEHPSSGNLEEAKKALDDRFRWSLSRVTGEHRQDEQEATHPCLHRAYLDYSESLDEVKTSFLLTPQVMPDESAEPPRESEPDDEPKLADVRDVIFGRYEVEEDHEEDQDGSAGSE